jgi:RecJ-like exonuclease
MISEWHFAAINLTGGTFRYAETDTVLDMTEIDEESKRAAEKLIGYRGKRIKIVTHIDADGVAAGSIASMALQDAGIEHGIEFVKQLDEPVLKRLRDEKWDAAWFTDLGSGYLGQIRGIDAVITDHHVPESAPHDMGVTPVPAERKTLFSYSDEPELKRQDSTRGSVIQFNPHLFGVNGATELSGAGTTYLVARHLSPKNRRLVSLAVVGAVGDLQEMANARLIGANSEIVNEAVSQKIISRMTDIRFFGRETRPLFKLFQYASDPTLPELSGSEEACVSFLVGLGIPLKEGKNWRRWIDLDDRERKKIVSELVKQLISKGMGHENARRVVGEVYVLPDEVAGTELHDAKEFATLLNACGRYEKAEIGYRVCCGDRDEYLKRAQSLLAGHRRTLVESIQLVRELGLVRLKNIQYFDAKDKIRDTVVGTVAGMLLNSGEIDSAVPIIALSDVKDPERGDGVKASSRGTKQLVSNGLDLSIVMKTASEAMGGFGGGHNIAAGAFIPPGKEKDFLELVDKMVGEQLKKG